MRVVGRTGRDWEVYIFPANKEKGKHNFQEKHTPCLRKTPYVKKTESKQDRNIHKSKSMRKENAFTYDDL